LLGWCKRQRRADVETTSNPSEALLCIWYYESLWNVGIDCLYNGSEAFNDLGTLVDLDQPV
jgi:hypothetical protein